MRAVQVPNGDYYMVSKQGKMVFYARYKTDSSVAYQPTTFFFDKDKAGKPFRIKIEYVTMPTEKQER